MLGIERQYSNMIVMVDDHLNGIILWCDNVGATYLIANLVFHARTKHVEIDFHLMRDKFARKELQVCFMSTKEHIAENTSKGLATTTTLSLFVTS
jgi:hypothetical protein